jgi:hypothetical protein
MLYNENKDEKPFDEAQDRLLSGHPIEVYSEGGHYHGCNNKSFRAGDLGKQGAGYSETLSCVTGKHRRQRGKRCKL